jgi:hypothetical protein
MSSLAGSLVLASVLCGVLAARVHVDGPMPREPALVADAETVERQRVACDPAVIAADLYLGRLAVEQAKRALAAAATESDMKAIDKQINELTAQLVEVIERQYTCEGKVWR